MEDERSPQRRLDHDVKTDRRRPGRIKYSSPALIRMLRGTYDAALDELHRLEDGSGERPTEQRRAEDRDDLRPARGIAFAVGLGAASWVVIGGAIWVLLQVL